MTTPPPPTRGDHVAVACAEAFRGDGAIMASGMGPMPALGARLARETFEPMLILTDGVATMLDEDGAPEGWMPYSRVFDTLWSGARHVMMGASQIDRYGNQNISCVGAHSKPKVQLLGVRGAPGNTIHHPTSYFVGDHNDRVFVEQVDMVSGVGPSRGAFDIRRVITNLCVMDTGGPEGTLRLVALHPGVSVEEVEAATGFPLARAAEIGTTRAPTPAEAAALDRLDPGGRIRGSLS
jgi:acyl CoA:acetate/3-ketoacid CoA transferase beta subunit